MMTFPLADKAEDFAMALAWLALGVEHLRRLWVEEVVAEQKPRTGHLAQ